MPSKGTSSSTGRAQAHLPPAVLNAADIASRSLQLTLHPFLLSNGGNPKIIFQSSLRADSAELHPEGLREEGEGEAGGLLIEAAERDELATTPAVTELSWVNASGDGVEPWVIKAFNSQGVTVLDVVNVRCLPRET